MVACLSPAQADIVKLSRAAKRYCYLLMFSRPMYYRHFMAELFVGASEQWQTVAAPDSRKLGFNVPFNILYDLGVNPTLNYIEGGWEYEGDTRADVYRYLAGFANVTPGKEDVFRRNADKRIVELENGRVRYAAHTQLYVLGWDPKEVDWDAAPKA